MLTLQIASHNVHKVLIVSGRSVDVLFQSAYNQIRLPYEIFKLTSTSLYGFFSCSVPPLRGVELLVTIGNHLAQAKIFTNFLMVDTPSIYNVIIRRPTLNALRVVASTCHLIMKFPTVIEVGMVYGNQVEAYHCYALALKEKENSC